MPMFVDRNKDPTQVPERTHAHLRTNKVLDKVTGQGTVKFSRNPKSTLKVSNLLTLQGSFPRSL